MPPRDSTVRAHAPDRRQSSVSHVDSRAGRDSRVVGSGPARESPMRQIFEFGPNHADGDGTMKEVLGGKGAGLAEMCRLGLPVPPGFTIATTVCPRFYKAGRR